MGIERGYVILSEPYISDTFSKLLKYIWDSNIKEIQENNPSLRFIFMDYIWL